MKQKRLLLLLALLMTAATGAWGMQIYISYPAWPSGTSVNSAGNLVLEMEPSDSFENLKSKIEDKTEGRLDMQYMHLFYEGTECPNNETLYAKGVAANSVLTLVYGKYTVALADGTADAGNWTATLGSSTTPQSLPVYTNRGSAVTLNYGGRLKVKSVTATTDAWMGDMSSIPASALEADGQTIIVPDGATLKGALNVLTSPYKVVIPDGATVTLAGVTIEGVNNVDYSWAGITCEGDATIILADKTENTVKGFYETYPGIYVPVGKKLTIKGGSDGNGKLTASSNRNAAGIGGGWSPLFCGDIDIQGGDITATGGWSSAGIGAGYGAKCGDITISGGTVTATGGQDGAGIGSGSGYGANCGVITIFDGTVKANGGQNGAGIGSGNGVSCTAITISGGTVEATGDGYGAGIGSGLNGTCGSITIFDGVTLVTATKGTYSTHSIGVGGISDGLQSTCGTVTIGGTVYWENNAAKSADADAYLKQAEIVYPEPDPLATPLTIEALTAGTIKLDMDDGTLALDIQYSVNGGTKKEIKTTPNITVAKGDKVQFYGNGFHDGGDGVRIQGSDDGFQTKVYGNIMSLLDETGFATKTELPNATYVFYELFAGNTTLIDASELLLPAATLTYACYQSMFFGCTSLTTAPKLPAATLADGCYAAMFQGCTRLTTAPKLPATTLADGCYAAMFMGCTSLTTAPKLPATTLAYACYEGMFSGCTSLTSAYVKAAYTEENYMCSDMFNGWTATDAVLHTTPDNKPSWQTKMGTGKTWSNWTVEDDWED